MTPLAQVKKQIAELIVKVYTAPPYEEIEQDLEKILDFIIEQENKKE